MAIHIPSLKTLTHTNVVTAPIEGAIKATNQAIDDAQKPSLAEIDAEKKQKEQKEE